MRADRDAKPASAVSYFVLRSPGESTELARLTALGMASFYEPVTDSWINDPLLVAEISNDSGWVPATADDLPPGVTMPIEDEITPRRRDRRRWARRSRREQQGRHALPKDA